ncbi:MAG: DUF6049 family protein, partial [Brachybacterium sp.]|nr:DUF6049 family protein [Brachybacterium sp.]
MPTPALPTSRGPASRRFGTERRGWLVAGILLMALLVLGAAPAQSIAAPSARPSVPTAPEQAADAPVEMELLRLDPQPLAPDGTLTAEVEVTNVSPAPIEDLALELHATSARVTDRAVLAAWESDTEPTVPGEPEA